MKFVGLVQSWAAIVFGILSGSIPWVTMMILHKKITLLQKVIYFNAFVFIYLFIFVKRKFNFYHMISGKTIKLLEQLLMMKIMTVGLQY